jgi:hypothetical protein
MRVKVRDTWYDGDKQSVMVELEDGDKENIAKMLPECKRYAQFPDNSMSNEAVDKWMKI